jgi:hypothetical protein
VPACTGPSTRAAANREEQEMPELGRNDPCWCGSGKKYKNCHMHGDELAASRVLTRRNLVEQIQGYALEPEFESDFMSAYEFLFGRKFESLHDEAEMLDLQRALDYFVHDYPLPDGTRVIDRFAAEHGKRLSAEKRTLIEDWRHSRLTAFEVIAVEREVGMRLRDLVSGEEFDVQERLGTRDLSRWEIVVTRLMPSQDHYEIGGEWGIRLP